MAHREGANHTPGPWTVHIGDYGDEWWFGGNGQRQFIIKAGDKNIACYGLWAKEDDEPDCASTEEALANAKLLAQAPNLLAALKPLQTIAFDAAVNSIPEAHISLRQALEEACANARAAIKAAS